MDVASDSGSAKLWTRRLLRCGVAAGPVFVGVFLVEGAGRDDYRPLRHPVSSLALGPRGWIQAANFAVAGTLSLAGAAGLARADNPAVSRRTAAALIGAAGAGLILSAAYSVGTAVTMVVTAALAGAGFGQSPRLVDVGGLFQRASIITGFAWLTAVSAQALRLSAAESPSQTADLGTDLSLLATICSDRV